MFSTQSENCTPFFNIFDIISLFAAEFKKPKIGVSGKGLRTVENLVGKGENADYYNIIVQNWIKSTMSIIVLLSPSHFFLL